MEDQTLFCGRLQCLERGRTSGAVLFAVLGAEVRVGLLNPVTDPVGALRVLPTRTTATRSTTARSTAAGDPVARSTAPLAAGR